MKPPLHLLLIAPSAPPKNSPEAIQVGRLLSALDPEVRVTLVTVPAAGGWARPDESLTIERPGLQVITLRLPFHRISHRFLSNWRLSRLHVPDADCWLPWVAGQVFSQLEEKPNVICSRSAPFSAALLARVLKLRLQIPWLMHLSDPWAGSPYRDHKGKAGRQDRRLEAKCFASADLITLTTEGQAANYRSRYPGRAEAIQVTPNMMPLVVLNAAPRPPALPEARCRRPSDPLRLVYTGSFYGARDPSTLLAAVNLLRLREPEMAGNLAADFYGNAPPDIAMQIEADPSCTWHGPVPFAAVQHVQAGADILLNIEPGGQNPLLLHFMPSKNMDYMAAGKPLLAITPHGSETAKLCAQGFGWSVAPGEVQELADLLQILVTNHLLGMRQASLPDLAGSIYRASKVAGDVQTMLARLLIDKIHEEAIL